MSCVATAERSHLLLNKKNNPISQEIITGQSQDLSIYLSGIHPKVLEGI